MRIDIQNLKDLNHTPGLYATNNFTFIGHYFFDFNFTSGYISKKDIHLFVTPPGISPEEPEEEYEIFNFEITDNRVQISDKIPLMSNIRISRVTNILEYPVDFKLINIVSRETLKTAFDYILLLVQEIYDKFHIAANPSINLVKPVPQGLPTVQEAVFSTGVLESAPPTDEIPLADFYVDFKDVNGDTSNLFINDNIEIEVQGVFDFNSFTGTWPIIFAYIEPVPNLYLDSERAINAQPYYIHRFTNLTGDNTKFFRFFANILPTNNIALRSSLTGIRVTFYLAYYRRWGGAISIKELSVKLNHNPSRVPKVCHTNRFYHRDTIDYPLFNHFGKNQVQRRHSFVARATYGVRALPASKRSFSLDWFQDVYLSIPWPYAVQTSVDSPEQTVLTVSNTHPLYHGSILDSKSIIDISGSQITRFEIISLNCNADHIWLRSIHGGNYQAVPHTWEWYLQLGSIKYPMMNTFTHQKGPPA